MSSFGSDIVCSDIVCEKMVSTTSIQAQAVVVVGSVTATAVATDELSLTVLKTAAPVSTDPGSSPGYPGELWIYPNATAGLNAGGIWICIVGDRQPTGNTWVRISQSQG